MKKIIILLPVYNDWQSLQLLISKIEKILSGNIFNAKIVVVDDGSTKLPKNKTHSHLFDGLLIHLQRNVGHQRAIALGIAYVSDNLEDWENLIVMDADGEDLPEDILKLLEVADENPDKVIFAHRRKRQEGFKFKLGYFIYKLLFEVLTGKKITFGNFSLIPKSLSRKISFLSEIASHYSGGIIKSKLPYYLVSVERGKRLTGKSKMNFPSLVLHGLSSIAVHADIVALRLLSASFLMIVTASIVVLIVLYIRFFTELATPGWATTVVSGALVLITQVFFLSFSLLFLILTYRSQNQFVPTLHYKQYVDRVVFF
ncbi:MAG: glycosyltransferase [Thermonemataceae bacterium]